jgi:hypothetical protein
MRRRLELAAVLIVVAAIVAATHWPVLGARAQSLDDNLFVTTNTLVNQPGWPTTWRFFSEVLHPSSVGGYYIPLSMTSLMIDVAMGGSASHLRPFHRTNLILHVLATLLVVLILYQLFGSAIPAGITGLLFGVHPFTVESLAWLSQRKTLLAACFGFASIAAYVRHRRGGGRWWWPAAIALYALGLMSKPTVVSLPVLLLVLDEWPLRRLTRQAVVEKWPFFLLALASSGIAIISQSGTAGNTAVPEAGPIRLLLQCCFLQVFYVVQLFWPRDLSALHPPPNPVALSNPSILVSAIVACALTVVLCVGARRWRAPLAGWTFYLVALAPTFGVLVWSVIYTYDHYLYFPVLGILLLVAAGLHAAWHSPRVGHRGIIVVLAAVLVATAVEVRATRATLHHWQNHDNLWQRILTILPDYPLIRQKYGELLTQEGRFAEAVFQLRQSVDQAPLNADFRYNLGLALSLDGRLDAALVEFQAAASNAPGDTANVRELARTLRRVGKLTEAEQQFRALLRLKADDIEALGQLATLLAARGETRDAIELARRSVTLAPGNASPSSPSGWS